MGIIMNKDGFHSSIKSPSVTKLEVLSPKIDFLPLHFVHSTEGKIGL